MSDVNDLIDDLHDEAVTAAAIAAESADLIREDKDFLADIIEGETDLRPVAARLLVAREADAAAADAMEAELAALIKRRGEERDRRLARIKTIDRALTHALQTAGIRRLELNAGDGYVGRVRLQTTPGALRVSTPVDDLPEEFVRVKESRSPDLYALRAALEDGREIDGVEIVQRQTVRVS